MSVIICLQYSLTSCMLYKSDIQSCRYYHFTTFSSMPPALPENSGE